MWISFVVVVGAVDVVVVVVFVVVFFFVCFKNVWCCCCCCFFGGGMWNKYDYLSIVIIKGFSGAEQLTSFFGESWSIRFTRIALTAGNDNNCHGCINHNNTEHFGTVPSIVIHLLIRTICLLQSRFFRTNNRIQTVWRDHFHTFSHQNSIKSIQNYRHYWIKSESFRF